MRISGWSSDVCSSDLLAADHPGLFYRMVGGIHLAGGNIIDARIHTTRDGLALDNFLVQDPLGRPFDEAGQLHRLKIGSASCRVRVCQYGEISVSAGSLKKKQFIELHTRTRKEH